MNYFVVISEPYSKVVNNVMVNFKVNSSYPLVQEDVEVSTPEGITFYNSFLYENIVVSLPYDSTVVISEHELATLLKGRGSMTPAEAYYETHSDKTEDYLSAYQDRLGIEVTTSMDIDQARFTEHDISERVVE